VPVTQRPFSDVLRGGADDLSLGGMGVDASSEMGNVEQPTIGAWFYWILLSTVGSGCAQRTVAYKRIYVVVARKIMLPWQKMVAAAFPPLRPMPPQARPQTRMARTARWRGWGMGRRGHWRSQVPLIQC
jgi:hypothetical protein